MSKSDAIRQLDFFACRLSALKDIHFPMHIVWQLPIPDGYLNVRVVEFRGGSYRDPLGFYYQGENEARNQSFFFYTSDLRGDILEDRWTITVNHWDNGVAGPGWLMDAPSRYRAGTPEALNQTMMQLVSGLIQYARDFCGYDDSKEIAESIEAIKKIQEGFHSRKLKLKSRGCDCAFCDTQLSTDTV